MPACAAANIKNKAVLLIKCKEKYCKGEKSIILLNHALGKSVLVTRDVEVIVNFESLIIYLEPVPFTQLLE